MVDARTTLESLVDIALVRHATMGGWGRRFQFHFDSSPAILESCLTLYEWENGTADGPAVRCHLDGVPIVDNCEPAETPAPEGRRAANRRFFRLGFFLFPVRIRGCT